jgi:hypothetical protein
MTMFFDGGKRKPYRQPRTRPPLLSCPTPDDQGPESGTDIPDLRTVLLELTAERAKLRRNQSLFQKETERFESVLNPLPAWLMEMYNLTPSRRRDIALYWAKRLQLTEQLHEGGRLWLDLSVAGRKWLALRMEEQYAFVYRVLREGERPTDSQSYWGQDYDDGWFLGSPVSVVAVNPNRHGRNDWAIPLTNEQRQPLREALYAAFAELPLGVFHRFDQFAAHVCFGLHNPLLLGRQSDEVLVRVAGRLLLPRDEARYDSGRHLLGQLVSNRLVSLGCLQAGPPSTSRRVLRPCGCRRRAGFLPQRNARRGATGFQRPRHRRRSGTVGGVAPLLRARPRT